MIIFKSYLRSYGKWANYFNDIIIKWAPVERKHKEFLYYMDQYKELFTFTYAEPEIIKAAEYDRLIANAEHRKINWDSITQLKKNDHIIQILKWQMKINNHLPENLQICPFCRKKKITWI